MFSKTIEFEINGHAVKVTVETETGRHYLKQRMIYGRAPINPDDAEDTRLWMAFADALSRSTVEGDLGFVWPSAVSDGATLTQARDGWLNLRGAVIEKWVGALEEVNTPPASIELTPAADEKKEPTPA